MSGLMQVLTLLSAVGAGAAAGVFFTFSSFTMEGLKRLEPALGAEAMKAINQEAPTAPFMVLLFGTGATCLATVVHAVQHLDDPASRYRLLGGLLYLAGVVLLTGLYHVPRNDLLDGFDTGSPEGIAYWAIYLEEWVRMNHVRTVAPLLTAVLMTLSLISK